MASQPRTCAMCDAQLGAANSSGYCLRHNNSRPEKRAKISEGLKRAHQTNPELRDIRRRAAVKNARDPAINAKRAAAARRDRVWEKGVAARTQETYDRIGATQRAQAIAWCPPHLRDDYRSMIRSGRFLAAEARRIILESHEVEMRRFRRSIGAEEQPTVTPAGVLFVDRASRLAAAEAGVPDL
jgi:hypothetical protein